MPKRITEAEKERMRELRAGGMSYQKIGIEVGRGKTSVACICDPKRKETWDLYVESAEYKKVRKVYNKSPVRIASKKAHMKKYRQTDEFKEKQREYERSPERKAAHYARQKTVQGRLRTALRGRLRDAIRGSYRVGNAVRDLGCTVEQLKTHLEAQFKPGMSWDNWSLDGWHVDHICPLASFDLTYRDQFLEACHYTNLQPLWAKDNLSKGSKILPAS